MLRVRFAAALGGLALLLGACQPAATPSPTAAPAKPTAAAPTVAPTSAPAATTAPAKPAATTAAAATTAPAAQKPTIDAVLAQYYEAAKSEPALIIYGAGAPEQFNPIRDAFVKRFAGVKIEGVDQRGRETREKLIAEQQSKAYVASLAISGVTTQNELRDAGLTEPFLSAQVDEMLPDLVLVGGWANPRSANLYSLTINTNLVPAGQEPKSWQDVLDPKWKGKLAMDDPRGSGPGGAVMSGFELGLGKEWTEKLATQNVTFAPQDGPLWAGLVRGEYAMFLSANHPDAVSQRRAGAPTKFIKPAEGVTLVPSSMALIKNGPAPNAAKLFIEWTLSEDGQTELAKQGYASIRKGAKALEPEADMTDVKFLPNQNNPDMDKYLGDVNARTKRYEELFFKQP